MKNAFKDWITNILAIIIAIGGTIFFFLNRLEFWPEFVGCIIIGIVLLFTNGKTLRELAVKYINKLINK